jgi:hypothetical protein
MSYLNTVSLSNTVNDYVNALDAAIGWINSVTTGLNVVTANSISANSGSILSLGANSVSANSLAVVNTLTLGGVNVAIQSTNIIGAGLISGSGNLAANVTLTVTAAAGSDINAGTNNSIVVTPYALAQSNLSISALNLKAPLASPALTGTPTAPTPANTSNANTVATTAFVNNVLSSYASLNAPTFSGVPSCSTAAIGAANSQIATTYFVAQSVATINSPALTGTPTAPTPANTSNANTIATTAYVKNNLASYLPLSGGTVTGSLGVTGSLTVNTGSLGNTYASGLTLYSSDYTGNSTSPTELVIQTNGVTGNWQINLWNGSGSTGSLNFGMPSVTATTPSFGDNSTKLATTAFVSQAISNSSSIAFLNKTAQSFSGGFRVTSYSVGTGSFTCDPGNGPYQYVTNNGSMTITAPSYDGGFDLLITNTSTPGVVAFSGFTVNSSTGDTITTSASAEFIVSIRRINGVSTYFVKALQ